MLGSSADLVIGESVIAVGSPLGLQGTVTAEAGQRPRPRGQPRRTGGAADDPERRPDQPRQLGCPLVDLDGRVVGVNTAIATLGGQGSGSIGIGFVVLIDRAVGVAERIIDGG